MCNISVACTVISHKTGQQAVVLDLHNFDDRNGWITKRSPPQPTVSLTARAHTKDYEELGYRLHTRTRQITIAMTADTGCQSVLVGIKIIHRLGFKKSDLIPVKTKSSAVNRDVIPILEAVILRLSGKSGSGKVIETAQICYVTDVIEGAYLSRGACTTLGIIPSDFPRIGSATQQPIQQPIQITEGVGIFDSKRVTCLATEWSKKGIGFGSCRTTAPVRSSLLSVAQRDGK